MACGNLEKYKAIIGNIDKTFTENEIKEILLNCGYRVFRKP